MITHRMREKELRHRGFWWFLAEAKNIDISSKSVCGVLNLAALLVKSILRWGRRTLFVSQSTKRIKTVV